MKRFYACCRNTALVGLLPLLLTGIAGPSYAQQVFSSPEVATTAFADAPGGSVLGANWRRYIPTESVDMDDVYRFLSEVAP
ncbi:MAG: hypothetical protein LJE97_10645 [Betaproteobacteria bacterium]|jgi:hypothetical protein|nr:hypothetical protein [Betaproteobacteria bacterium]